MNSRGHPFPLPGGIAALPAETPSPASISQDDLAPALPPAAALVDVVADPGPASRDASAAAEAPQPPLETPAGAPATRAPATAFAPLTAFALGTGRATQAEHADPAAANPSGPTEAPASSVAPRPAASAWSWVPIRSLGGRHRERILAHLLALDERARYLRFGFAATDAQLAQYVDRIDFDRDEVFGIFNRRLQLIALAHLAHPSSPGINGRPPMSEFGVSVLARARRRGFGRRLFEHATLHSRNRGVKAMFIHALSENAAMLKIARDAGATVHREGSETEAWLELPPDTFASHLDELVGTHAAELDYRLKSRVQQVSQLLGRDTGDSEGRDAEAPSGVE